MFHLQNPAYPQSTFISPHRLQLNPSPVPSTPTKSSLGKPRPCGTRSIRDFESYRLRRILRENHGFPIEHAAFNTTAPGGLDCSNILATVGGGQANIYDNAHRGSFLDLVVNHTVPESPDWWCTVSWISPDEYDSLMVLGGRRGKVKILSLAYRRVVGEFQAAQKDISWLGEGPIGTLLVADGCTLGIWKVEDWTLLKKIDGWAPTCGCRYGEHEVLFGTSDGRIASLDMMTGAVEGLDVPGLAGRSIVDIHFVGSDSFLITKTTVGIDMFDAQDPSRIRHIRHVAVANSGKARLGVSHDQRFLATGTADGTVLVFDLNGRQATIRCKRTKGKAVRCVAFAAENCNQIIVATDDAYVWRFDDEPIAVVEEI